MGGSLTVPNAGFISIDPHNGATVTKPVDAELLFNTGSSDFTNTRSIYTWMGSDVVQVQTLEYMTLTTTANIFVNPWYSSAFNYNYQVHLYPATDGWQVPVNSDTAIVFSPDLSQTIQFNKTAQTQGTAFSDYDTVFYTLDGAATYEPADLNAETHNLTSTYAAPMFACSGNFWNVPAITGMQYPIDATTGKLFAPNAETGNSYIITNANTGQTLEL